jgi:flagellar basal body-associated protein FliL
MDGIIMLVIVTATLGSFGYVMYLIHKESRKS